MNLRCELVLLPLLLTFCMQSGFAEAAPPPNDFPKTTFSENFSSPDDLKHWDGLREGISVEVEGTNSFLHVTRRAAAGPGSLVISRMLATENLRGCRIRCQARVRAKGVARPPQVWNGIKLMLHTDSPSEGKQWLQQNDVWGDFDWRNIRFSTSLPEDLTTAQLYLGLEQTTGDVWFDDVQVVILRDLVSGQSNAPARGPVYTGHKESRLRGAMVAPDLSPESLHVLASEWHANLIRWQLIRYVAPAGETALSEYERWLDGEMARLDRILTLCATNGVRVVIDLHSPPGGSRISSGYVAADAGLFTNKAAQVKFVEVWQRMARRYRDNSVVWGYDLVNEPVEETLGDDCESWQELATRTAKAIREIDSQHTIIVEPSPWGGPAAIRNLDPLPVPGVVYSVHMYVPHHFTHQGIQGHPGDVHYPGKIERKDYDKQALARVLQPVVDFQKRHHVQIYLGEFSAIRWAPGAADYLHDCIELFEEHGWDWSYHAFREYHGWSVEHDSDPKHLERSQTETDRQNLLRSWFSKNGK